MEPLGRSDNFTVYGLSHAGGDESDIVVFHDFLPEQIDNNIGSYVADELLPLLARSRPGSSLSPDDDYAYSEQETFERYVGAIVRSIDGNERRAWHRFYDNTLAALHAAVTLNGGRSNDFIRSFRAIYARVAELTDEVRSVSILDAATCFGFLPLFPRRPPRLRSHGGVADHRLRSQCGAGRAGGRLPPAAAHCRRELRSRRYPRRRRHQ